MRRQAAKPCQYIRFLPGLLLGVWLGMFIDWICRGIFFMVRFVRGKWMEHKVI